jgi:hypothetical protein
MKAAIAGKPDEKFPEGNAPKKELDVPLSPPEGDAPAPVVRPQDKEPDDSDPDVPTGPAAAPAGEPSPPATTAPPQ